MNYDDIDALLSNVLGENAMQTEEAVMAQVAMMPAPVTDEDPMAALMASLNTPVEPAQAAITVEPLQVQEAVQPEQQIASIRMPVFVPDDYADTIDVRQYASLVTLSTNRWHAKAKDRKSGEDIAVANDAKSTAFEVRKHLLAGADTMLKDIHKALDAARADHYRMTLPWTTTGMEDNGRRTGARLLMNSLFFEYTEIMAKHKRDMNDKMGPFVAAYPGLIQQAQQQLGKRFNPMEYPPATDIRRHFGMDFDFQPVPKGEDFKGLPAQQLDALARKVNNNITKMAQNAMEDLWSRAIDVVGRMAERLSSPDKAFHDTLIGNARELSRLMEHLNLTSSPKIADMQAKISKHLCQHEPQVLRDNAVIRREVAAAARSIEKELKQ
jgi:hypothetical protein